MSTEQFLTAENGWPAAPGAARSAAAARRDFLSFSTLGIGAIALGQLLREDGVARAATVPPQAADPGPHHRQTAKRVIHIVLTGGLSQVDTFDYKPALARLHG